MTLKLQASLKNTFAKRALSNLLMKKGICTTNLTIKRISSSPYFSDQFLKNEQEQLEAALNIKFVESECADILITNTHTNLNELSHKQLNRCQIIVHPNSGYDNFNAEFVATQDFPIVIGHTIRSQAVANFILSNLMSHFSPTPKHKVWDRERKWKRKLLSELTVLIIGNGHIGKILESTLRPLCGELRIFDPYLGLNTLDLKNVDVVLLAMGLNKKNDKMIDQYFLSKLNSDFLIINAARGSLINTTDLINSLKNNPNAFAYLDVFEVEPCDFSLFDSIKNISLSSHVAGVYRNIDQATINFEIKIITDFINLEIEQFKTLHSSLLLSSHLSDDNSFLI